MGDFTQLGKLLRGFVDRGIPGCSCSVYRRGELLFQDFVGLADIETMRPIEEDTIFRIYSMTKVITCVAALKLYERGLFDLNEPLADYLPEFSSPQVARRSARGELYCSPAASPIRVRDLFTMSSGLSYPGSGMETEIQTAAAWEALRAEADAGRPFDARGLSRALAKVPLAFDPGTHWLYGQSHDVLGALVEVLAGKKLGSFFQDEIFAPLSMADSFFRLPAAKGGRLCSLYARAGDGSLARDLGRDEHYQAGSILEKGGGGLLSTLGDYSRFARMLAGGGELEGERILGSGTIGLMATNHLSPVQLADLEWSQMAGYGYGLGVRTMIDRAAAGGNGSLGEFGWAGLAGTWTLMDPKLELAAVYMQQMIPSLEPALVPRLRAVIYGALG